MCDHPSLVENQFMGWFSKIFGSAKHPHALGPTSAGGSTSGRSRAAESGKCDMCSDSVAKGSGWLHATDEVVTTEAYWLNMLGENRHQGFEAAPNGQLLADLVQHHAADESKWCLCEECNADVAAGRSRGAFWDEKASLMYNAAAAAGYAWLTTFGRWPPAIARREASPPEDGTPCAQCGRRAYSDEQVSLLKADLIQELEAAAAIEVRFRGEGALPAPAFCLECLTRALRMETAWKGDAPKV